MLGALLATWIVVGVSPARPQPRPRPVASSPAGPPGPIRLRLHLLSNEVTGLYNGPHRAFFARVAGQRSAYISTQGPGAVYHYDLRDLGANPQLRSAEPRYRKLYGDLARGTVALQGVLNDAQHTVATPLVVTAEHAGATKPVVLLERLVEGPSKLFAPRPVDPKPRNSKYQFAYIGDFNGDGHRDVIATYAAPVSKKGPVRMAMTLYLYGGGPSGQLRYLSQLHFDDFHAGEPVVTDLDGDKRDELLLVDDCSVRGNLLMFCSGEYRAGSPLGPTVVVVEQTNNALHVRHSQRLDRAMTSYPLVVADLDGDGRRDLLTGVTADREGAYPYQDQALLYRGQPDGRFAEGQTLPLGRFDWSQDVDFDGDGRAEVVHAGLRSWIVWRLNEPAAGSRAGSSAQGAAAQPAMQKCPVELALGPGVSVDHLGGWITDRFDFDGDGDVDLLMVGQELTRRRGKEPTVKSSPIFLVENLTPQVPRRPRAGVHED